MDAEIVLRVARACDPDLYRYRHERRGAWTQHIVSVKRVLESGLVIFREEHALAITEAVADNEDKTFTEVADAYTDGVVEGQTSTAEKRQPKSFTDWAAGRTPKRTEDNNT